MSTPTEVESYGPNGTHWPNQLPTPFMYDDGTAGNVVNVACSWAAIQTALDAVTATQANVDGTLILVADGTLTGNGEGSASTAVITATGDSTWTQRVTVAPASGYGGVTFSGGPRIQAADGICWAGFKGDGSRIAFSACNNAAVAWTSGSGFYIWGAEGNGITGNCDTFEIVEFVNNDVSVGQSDRCLVQSAGGNISNLYFTGTYLTPRYLPTGFTPPPKNDTCQFIQSGGGTVTEIFYEDSVFFASSNAAATPMIGYDLDHTALIGGDTAKERYPYPAGAATSTGGTYSSLNGNGANINFTNGCWVSNWNVGTGDAATPVDSVTSSKIKAASETGTAVPASGGWTLVPSETLSDIGLPDEPTDSYLEEIWAGAAVLPAPIKSSSAASAALIS
jgi:hypothetical protein